MPKFEEPLAPLLSGDHASLAFVSAIVFLSVSGLLSFMKLLQGIVKFRRLRADDCATVLSLIFNIIYTVLSCLAMGYASSPDRPEFRLYYYISNLFVCPTLALAKASAVLFTAAIFTSPRMNIALNIILGFIFVWAVISELIMALQCHPDRLTLGPSSHQFCVDQYDAQIFVKVADMILDLIIALLPGIAVHKLQIPSSKRWIVTVTFGLRVVTIPVTALTLSSLDGFYGATGLGSGVLAFGQLIPPLITKLLPTWRIA